MKIHNNTNMPNMVKMMRTDFFGLAGKPMPEKHGLSGPKIKDLAQKEPFLITSPSMALEIAPHPDPPERLTIMLDGKLSPLKSFGVDMVTYNNFAFFGRDKPSQVLPMAICDTLSTINALPERLRPMRMGLGNIFSSQHDSGEHAALLFLEQNAPAISWIFACKIFAFEAFCRSVSLPQPYIQFLTDTSQNAAEKMEFLSDIVCAQALLTFEMAFEAKYVDASVLVLDDKGPAMYKFDFAEKIHMDLKQLGIK